jgi:uncharacterized protein YgiM (DUF1202 family)
MMKTICTILGTLMAASLLAQDNTNSLPAMPAPVSSPAAETAPAPESTMAPAATPAPAAPKHHKRHVMKKKAAKAEPSVTLTPGPAEVSASELIVRGQAGLKGEMVAHLYKGDSVTILEQINLAHHEADEPSQWAKISYPTNAHVWVDAKYVDTSGVVKSKKLNLRAGPGENYSVVGVIEQGTQLTPEGTKDNWMKIAPPASAYAFVAAKYLNQEAPQQVATTAPPETPEVAPTPTPVPQPQPIVTTPPPAPEPATPETPPAPSVRIVQHEGVIGPVGSMIAPTAFKLYDPDTKVDIDYLYVVPGSSIDLSPLIDARVIVTGEEGIDQRWPNTPVIAVQNVQVIATKVIKRLDLTPPRQRH